MDGLCRERMLCLGRTVLGVVLARGMAQVTGYEIDRCGVSVWKIINKREWQVFGGYKRCYASGGGCTGETIIPEKKKGNL